MDGPEGRAGCAVIDGGEVATLTSPAIVEDRLTAVLFADDGQTRGHLRDRCVPVDLLEAPVTASAERLRQSMRTVLIEVEPMCLLARIALRCGVRIVAAYFHQVAAVFAAELDFDAAVAFAQDTSRGLPLRVGDTRNWEIGRHYDLLEPERCCSKLLTSETSSRLGSSALQGSCTQ